MALLTLPHFNVRRTCFDLVYINVAQKGEHQTILHIHFDIFFDIFLPFQDEEEEIKLEINVLRKVCCKSTFSDGLKDLE